MSSGDRDFIQTYCVDAIRLKRQERVQTKAAKVGQEEAKQEEELKVEDNEDAMLAQDADGNALGKSAAPEGDENVNDDNKEQE